MDGFNLRQLRGNQARVATGRDHLCSAAGQMPPRKYAEEFPSPTHDNRKPRRPSSPPWSSGRRRAAVRPKVSFGNKADCGCRDNSSSASSGRNHSANVAAFRRDHVKGDRGPEMQPPPPGSHKGPATAAAFVQTIRANRSRRRVVYSHSQVAFRAHERIGIVFVARRIILSFAGTTDETTIQSDFAPAKKFSSAQLPLTRGVGMRSLRPSLRGEENARLGEENC